MAYKYSFAIVYVDDIQEKQMSRTEQKGKPKIILATSIYYRKCNHREKKSSLQVG